MLRRDIVAGLDEVARLLETDGLAYVESLGQGGEPDRAGALHAYREIANAIDQMTAAGHAILDGLGLIALADVTSWTKIVGLETNARGLSELSDELKGLHGFIRVAQALVPRLRLILLNDALAAEYSLSRKNQLLTITLYDDGPRPNSPARDVAAITCVTDVFEVAARLANVSPASLELIGADSGSDRTFNFLGPEKIIAEVRTFFLEVFDRVVFLRQRKASVEMKNAEQALSLLEKINEAEKQRRIAPEEAEILRRKTIGARTKAIEAGALPPDFALTKESKRRLDGSREPKLLQGHEDEDTRA